MSSESLAQDGHELTTVYPMDVVVVQFEFNAGNKKEKYLSMQPGNTVYVLAKDQSGWWDGLIIDEKSDKAVRGWFPQNYTKPLRDHHRLFGKRSSSRSSRRSSFNSTSRPSVAMNVIGGNAGTGDGGSIGAYLNVVNSRNSMSRRGSSHLAQSSTSPMLMTSTSGSLERTNSMPHNALSPRMKGQDNARSSSVISHKPNLSTSSSRSMSSVEVRNPREASKSSETTADKHEEIKVLSLEEIEMVINSLHSDITPTWVPIPLVTTSGVEGKTNDKLVYYNKDLDLYCSELPLISNLNFESELEANRDTKFPTHDHLVSLQPKYLKTITAPSPRTTPSSDIPADIDDAASTNKSEKDTNDHGNTDNTEAKKYEKVEKNEKNEETDGHKKQHSSHVKQPVMSRSDWFYQLSKDITTWSELHDLTAYYAKLAHRMFLSDNKYNFMKFFDLTSNYITFMVLACRLIQNQEKLRNLPKDIKKVFKHMITSLGKININSRLFFDASLRKKYQFTGVESLANNTQNQNIDNNDDAAAAGKAREDIFENSPNAGDSPLAGKRNVSTSTTDTLIPYHKNSLTTEEDSGNNSDLISPSYIDANQFYAHSLSNYQRNSVTASTPRTSIQSTGINSSAATPTAKENIPKSLTKTIYDIIDTEFNRLFKHIQYLHHILQMSVINGDDALPQLLPRFLKSSFNGGSWNNPFSSFISSDSTINQKNSSHSSTRNSNNDILSRSHNSSLSAIQGKLGDSFASAAGSSGFVNDNPLMHSSSAGNLPPLASAPSFVNSSKGNPARHFLRNRPSKRRSRYPLNNETLATMNRISSQIYDRLNSLNGEHLNIMNQPKTRMRNLEINSSIYEQVNQNNLLLEILENLDLTIFINLKRLIKAPPSTLDPESQEFLIHAMSSISSVLIEFFDIKQAFHDIVMRLIMTSQQTTLDDPYSFASMRSNLIVGYYEPMKRTNTIGMKSFNQRKTDKHAAELYKSLVSQDVEFNDLNFLNNSDDFIDACEKYVEIANLSCIVVEQLTEERENLLNYAARMMKNRLTTELLKGEQERWFDIYSENNSDDEDELPRENEAGEENEAQKEVSGQVTELPWFLLPEYEDDLIYDTKGKIRGGTKVALIEHLTCHSIIDASFNVTLLMTFRSFMTTREFFYALIYRYNLYPPEGLSFDEYNIWIERKLNPVKCRVVNIMKTFLTQYWTPKYNESGVGVIVSFAKMAVSEKIPGSDILLSKINENIFGNDAQTPLEGENPLNSLQSVGLPTKNNVEQTAVKLHSSMKSSDLLDIDPYLYAAQLTLIEHDLYLRITMFECLDRAWGNKYCDMGGSPNITRFIANANSLTNYVSFTIVKHADVQKRAKLIQYFITVAQHCKELNNFSSMTAIVSALYSSPIYRLKQTWNLVPTETKEVLDNLNSLMDSKRNFIKYRELLRSVKDVACVPFFGVYLSDLTFTFAGNSDYLDGKTDIINFGKRSKIANIIEGILTFKKFHYKLKRLDDVQTGIEEGLEGVPHIEKQYQLSLQIEPRPETTKTGNTSGHHSHDRLNKSSNPEYAEEKPQPFINFRRKKQTSKFFG